MGWWNSSEVLQHVFNGLRVLCDYGQQHTRRRIRTGSPLLPVSKRGGRKAEFQRELRLAQAHAAPDLQHIYVRNLNLGHPNGNILALRPCQCLLETFNDPSTYAGGFLRARLRGSFFHCTLQCTLIAYIANAGVLWPAFRIIEGEASDAQRIR